MEERRIAHLFTDILQDILVVLLVYQLLWGNHVTIEEQYLSLRLHGSFILLLELTAITLREK